MQHELFRSVLGYVAVGVLWGCSNPFIKQAQGDSQSTNESAMNLSNIVQSLKTFITNPRMFLPYMVNQSGSLIYYYMLSSEPVSRAGPICNSLTFMFTALTGYFYFREEVKNPGMLFLGVAIVIVSIAITLM